MGTIDDTTTDGWADFCQQETWYSFRLVRVREQTDKALLIRLHRGPVRPREQWIPFSQMGPGTTVKRRGDTGTLVLTSWICNQKGLTQYADATVRKVSSLSGEPNG
jgi:hypothetical protein